MATQPTLTFNDNAVLSQMFDPESASTNHVLIDTSLPADPIITDVSTFKKIEAQETTIIRQLESALKESRTPGGRDQALAEAYLEMEALVSRYPDSAALRNDYAQIFRLQHGDDVLVSSTGNPTAQEVGAKASKAFLSLSRAVDLLSPATPQSSISIKQCKTLAQAHTQRGALYHAAARKLSSTNGGAEIVVKTLEGWSALDFQEAASRDFFMGGRYGSEIGKALAVHTNPTAKLCGQMVQDAIRREWTPNQLARTR